MFCGMFLSRCTSAARISRTISLVSIAATLLDQRVVRRKRSGDFLAVGTCFDVRGKLRQVGLWDLALNKILQNVSGRAADGIFHEFAPRVL